MAADVHGLHNDPYQPTSLNRRQLFTILLQETNVVLLNIQVNKDEYNKDKKFSLKITSSALELTNTQDGNIGPHLQVSRGGTHLNGVGSELTNFILFCSDLSFLLQLVSFTVDSDPL